MKRSWRRRWQAAKLRSSEIRDTKSYKLVAGYDTFEAFCRSEWDMKRRNAYYYIDAAQVIENVQHVAQIKPDNVRQTIPMQKLKTPEEQQKAWTRVLELAGPDQKVTAKLVKSVVDEFTAPEPPKEPEPPKDMTGLNNVKNFAQLCRKTEGTR